MDRFGRYAMLIGEEGIKTLSYKRVLVLGLGGVGGACLLSLARSGVGHLTLIDGDEVNVTNINRQSLADETTLGMNKAEVGAARVKAINPDCEVNVIPAFYHPENPLIDFKDYDYVVDCIDDVPAKIDVLKRCNEVGVPLISALGCGNRLDPSKLHVTDIHKKEGDPLAKKLRKACRDLGIKKWKVVCSTELPIEIKKTAALEKELELLHKTAIPGSSPFVPPAAGILLAATVVADLIV